MTTFETTCRRCGVDPRAGSRPYSKRLPTAWGEEIQAIVLRLCEPCSRDFASDAERDEYLRLGVLA